MMQYELELKVSIGKLTIKGVLVVQSIGLTMMLVHLIKINK